MEEWGWGWVRLVGWAVLVEWVAPAEWVDLLWRGAVCPAIFPEDREEGLEDRALDPSVLSVANTIIILMLDSRTSCLILYNYDPMVL